MIAIDKSQISVPESLTDNIRQKAFIANASNEQYISDNKYQSKDVQDALNTIYNMKCAYCEKKLLDVPKSIEHYRPKKSGRRKKCDDKHGYFWLAFSWDNLLLACTSCNSSKGSCFDIEGERIKYSDYKDFQLKELQSIISELDKIEKPLLVNPEQELQQFFNENLNFEPNGKIFSNNKRLDYTIEICNLNRMELKEKRLEIKNDLINQLKVKIYNFKEKHKNSDRLKDDILDLRKIVCDKIKQNGEFTAWQGFLIENFKELIKSIVSS